MSDEGTSGPQPRARPRGKGSRCRGPCRGCSVRPAAEVAEGGSTGALGREQTSKAGCPRRASPARGESAPTHGLSSVWSVSNPSALPQDSECSRTCDWTDDGNHRRQLLPQPVGIRYSQSLQGPQHRPLFLLEASYGGASVAAYVPDGLGVGQAARRAGDRTSPAPDTCILQ